MNIYSRIDPTQLLHIIQRKRDIQPGRVDLVAPDQFIQVATLRQPQGTTYRPHKHIWKCPGEPDVIAQESWIVVTGLVAVTLYDIDDTILHTDILEPGDCSITLAGGHNYSFMQDGFVYEFKTGPYLGQENDKIMI